MTNIDLRMRKKEIAHVHVCRCECLGAINWPGWREPITTVFLSERLKIAKYFLFPPFHILNISFPGESGPFEFLHLKARVDFCEGSSQVIIDPNF